MSTLEEILYRLRKPRQFPSALPLIHVSKLHCFKQIIGSLHLSPQECRVFNKYLLYFSYGGVFYETGNQPNREKTKLPICLLFNPRALSQINYYYPYDTGAAHFQKYGLWSELLTKFDQYKVLGNGDFSIPSQLVYHIYGSNINYIHGKVKPSHKCQRKLVNSFPDFFDFLRSTTIEGCDQRQYTIECQTEHDMSLIESLEWIAFPNSSHSLFANLFKRMQPSPPERYVYDDEGAILNPQHILGLIKDEAHKYIKRRYLEIS